MGRLQVPGNLGGNGGFRRRSGRQRWSDGSLAGSAAFRRNGTFSSVIMLILAVKQKGFLTAALSRIPAPLQVEAEKKLLLVWG